MWNAFESTMDSVWQDWLAVSTDGFASMNAGRDPCHLVKELIQNALDALSPEGGEVIFTATVGDQGGHILISCRDNGCGMTDLREIRTVFHTSKTDSHHKRGRMGRGFKELLCLARSATVSSGNKRIRFVIEHGKRITREEALPESQSVQGTLVDMDMPWDGDVIPPLVIYLAGFLVPPQVRLVVNGNPVPARDVAYRIEASLPTELFDNGRWVRPSRSTTVELIPIRPGETATLFELGIPVCPMDWTPAYHTNILQRVPMNPGRDAVATGFLLKLHKSCLPTLLPQMPADEVRQDWVGQAVPHCDPEVQQQVIRKGFGENLARSVPKMGVRQFDEDARDLGVDIVDTRQTSGGFRQILQQHIPTTREVVEKHQKVLLSAAAGGSFEVASVPDSPDARDKLARQRRRWIDVAGGLERIKQAMEFAGWFCQRLMDGYADSAICLVTVAELGPVNAVATWSDRDVLTLGIDTPWLWQDPLGERTLSVLIHEAAHHLNAHHGRDFHKEVEVLAGRAARLMLLESQNIRRLYGQLLTAPAVSV